MSDEQRYPIPAETCRVVDEIKRTPAGKADYRWAKQAALDATGTPV